MPKNLISPPRPKSPHLNALRAFEASARLENFVAAAEELCVTPGAISQHIKSLEAWAEADLFVRNTRGVTLTPLGAELLPKFVIAFDRLSDAVQALRKQASPNKFRIATLPAIAQLWLSERLGILRQSLPEIVVSVYAFESIPNMRREPFDIALFYSEDPITVGEFALAQDSIFPVCTPKVAESLRTARDLERFALLKDAAWHRDWEYWLKSLDEPLDFSPQGPHFSLFSVALEEALNGAGVLIAHEALVQKHLREGRLVQPFEHQVALNRRLVMKATPQTLLNPYFQEILAALSDAN